jgi:hypothetical protein
MDEQSRNIIKKKLQKIGDVRLNKDHLKELRQEISQGTGHNKFASFTNIRKWVAMVKKEQKKEASAPKKEKERPMPAYVDKKDPVEHTAAISDRVFMQTIGYEIASIRRSMDRISTQLTDIEKKLSSKREE